MHPCDALDTAERARNRGVATPWSATGGGVQRLHHLGADLSIGRMLVHHWHSFPLHCVDGAERKEGWINDGFALVIHFLFSPFAEFYRILRVNPPVITSPLVLRHDLLVHWLTLRTCHLTEKNVQNLYVGQSREIPATYEQRHFKSNKAKTIQAPLLSKTL